MTASVFSDSKNFIATVVVVVVAGGVVVVAFLLFLLLLFTAATIGYKGISENWSTVAYLGFLVIKTHKPETHLRRKPETLNIP